MSYCRITGKFYPATEMTKVYSLEEDRYILVSSEVDTRCCHECGRRFIVGDLTKAKNEYWNEVLVCEECLENDYYKCNHCEEYYHINITQEVYNGNIVCQNCCDDYYTYCEACGTYYINDDTYETETDGRYLCYRCASNYSNCSICGRVIYDEDPYYLEEDEYGENPMCSYCYRERANAVIHSYGYKPYPMFKRVYHDKKNTKEYFGFEIEVEGNTNYAEDFLKYFDEEEVYLKRDGSVLGFEIVTQPMTRLYFYRKFVPKLQKGMDFLRKNGFRGHNRAGIHIHVSNDAISQDQFKKLMLLLYPEQDKVYQKWLAITQRKQDRMEQWSSMKLGNRSKEDTRYKKKEYAGLCDRRKQDDNNIKPVVASRYTAINTGNIKTVEFRIFNSNVRTERIVKNAQVIFSLLDFTNTNQLPTFHNYMRFIEDNKKSYGALWEFLLEKHIYQPRVEKKALQKVLATVQEIDNSVSDYKEMMNKLMTLTTQPVVNEEYDREDIMPDGQRTMNLQGGTIPCV